MDNAKKEIASLRDYSDLVGNIVSNLETNVIQIASADYTIKQDQYSVNDLLEKINSKIFQLKNQAFKILVIGEFKKGKSTLINSLIGQEILPAYSRPCTDVVNEVCWGNEEKILIQKIDNSIIEIKRADFEKYVTIGGEFNSEENKTKSAQVFFPVDYCLNGVSIVDTPGLNEDIKRNNTTIGFLPSADAVIFVLSADQPCSMTELLMIEDLVKVHGFKYIFFVCNRINVIRAKEVEDLKKYVSEKMDPYLLKDQRVYFIDALSALENKLEGKDPHVDFRNLEESINKHLINNRALVRARNIMHELDLAYEVTQKRVSQHLKSLDTDLSELDKKIQEQVGIQDENQALQKMITDYWRQRKEILLDQFVDVIKFQYESGSIEHDIRSNIQKVCALGGRDEFKNNEYCNKFLEAILTGWLKRNLENQVKSSFKVILENEFSKISQMTFEHISKYLSKEEATLIKNDLSQNISFNLSDFISSAKLTILLDTQKEERLKNRNMLMGSLLFAAIDMAFTGGGVSLLLSSLTGISAGSFISKEKNDHSEFVNLASIEFLKQLDFIKNKLFIVISESIELIILEMDKKISDQIGNQLESIFKLIEQRQLEYQFSFEERENLKLEISEFLKLLNFQKDQLANLS